MSEIATYELADESLERCLQIGAFGDSRGSTQPIADFTVSAALAIVDAAGIGTQVEVWRAEDATAKHAGGRPHALDDRAIVALFVLLALEGTPLFVTNIAHVIERRLSGEARSLLRICQRSSEGDQWYDRCWRAVHRLLDVIDPYPAPRKRRLSREEFARIEALRDPMEVARREDRLNHFSNELLMATWQMLSRDVRRRWKGNVCVDATPVVAFARG